ncbi:GGDEF domain-containing protein [archaeon]|nr:GGDEF domain-containing protein [archaeon]
MSDYDKQFFTKHFSQKIISLSRKHGISVLVDPKPKNIDYFKNYNDHYGHIQGDKCLQAVATALQNCCKRPTDFCARFGGEEFVVVWYPTKSNSPEVMAKAIRHELGRLKIEHAESSVADYVTVSGGIVYWQSKNIISNDDLFHLADNGLYKAKDSGRDQFIIIDGQAIIGKKETRVKKSK